MLKGDTMSNVKEVKIEGQLPFDMLYKDYVTSRNPPKQLLRFFAMFSAPAWGLRIDYCYGSSRPNKHGGQTTYYEFEITGQEAFNLRYLHDRLKEMIIHGAEIELAKIRDIELPSNLDLSVKELHDSCRGLIVYGK